MGGLWSRARCCPFIISIKTHQYSTLRPAQITMPLSQNFVSWKILPAFYIYMMRAFGYFIYKYIPACALPLALSTLRQRFDSHTPRAPSTLCACILSHSKISNPRSSYFWCNFLLFTAFICILLESHIYCLWLKT